MFLHYTAAYAMYCCCYCFGQSPCKNQHMPYLVAIVDCTHADHTQITVPIDTTSKTPYANIFRPYSYILLMLLFYSSFS